MVFPILYSRMGVMFKNCHEMFISLFCIVLFVGLFTRSYFLLICWLFVCLFVCLSVCLFVCLSVCLSVCLLVCLFVCLFCCHKLITFVVQIIPHVRVLARTLELNLIEFTSESSFTNFPFQVIKR